MTTEAVVWLCVGLVVAGIALVFAATVPLSRRARGVRRALRRLSWRREELERLAVRAEGLQSHLMALQERAEELAARRAAHDNHP